MEGSITGRGSTALQRLRSLTVDLHSGSGRCGASCHVVRPFALVDGPVFETATWVQDLITSPLGGGERGTS